MKVFFVCDADGAGSAATPLSSLDRRIVDELRRQCTVEVVSAGSTDGNLTVESVMPVDVVITSGWAALEVCEARRVMPQVHLLGDLEAPLADQGPRVSDAAAVSRRKAELLDRPLRILTRSRSDARWLRARGRFPWHLAVDSAAVSPELPTSTTVLELVADLQAAPEHVHRELPLDEALRRASRRLLADDAAMLEACLSRGGPRRIQTLNLQHLYLAKTSPIFRQVIAAADAVTADGWPVVQLLKSAAIPVERATGADLVSQLLSDARVVGLRMAILGGAGEPATEFADLAAAAGASVVFREHGNKQDWDPRRLAVQLNECNAQLTLVAVTQPIGDLLAAELKDAGYAGTAIGIGAAVELYVGGERRAATWIQKFRLEWLYRFVQDPKRLWRRYGVEGIPTYFTVVLPMVRRRKLAPRGNSVEASIRRGYRGRGTGTR